MCLPERSEGIPVSKILNMLTIEAHMSRKTSYVYIMGSAGGALYIGVTNDIERRVWQHKKQQEYASQIQERLKLLP